VGLALLSVESLDTLAPRPGDLLVLASAAAWAGHVVAVGRFTGRYSSAGLALGQMAVASALHLAGTFIVGTGLQLSEAGSVWTMLFLTGILGSGVAFTIQVFAQRRLTPVRAAIILAGESVFAALFAALLGAGAMAQDPVDTDEATTAAAAPPAVDPAAVWDGREFVIDEGRGQVVEMRRPAVG
jgi:drug/metabolite transporter (DMT)-like permease